ncbi:MULTISPECIES: sulfurtransferase complex subunit TusB [unclassified Vibrio]|uniref:Sulfurtransferase complex subunit TusB n=1 Tax=Vibrio sp. HB236076 TaxID=3232307 RepID=A0AB39HDZ1_9VIBR|nr:sulfurtransferase complex subunit TusB [Vibrio sp. HB161653]MDP5255338.1 sulfurtransferase complex subunit TusB [Vibrio sp. HB161653]
MLHIVKSQTAIIELMPFISAQDQILLIEEAVYGANPKHEFFPYLNGLDVAVLEADLKARGLCDKVSPQLRKVDYSAWVELTVDHPQSMTWE